MIEAEGELVDLLRSEWICRFTCGNFRQDRLCVHCRYG